MPLSTNERLNGVIGHCVQHLGREIGERNDRDAVRYAQLGRARDFIVEQLSVRGHVPQLLAFRSKGMAYENIELRLPGADSAAPALVVGAHYDTARKAPGANDNGTGVACLIALAHLLADETLGCPIRLVAFTNEEPPHTRKSDMGSLVYARELAAQHVPVRGMISLETLAPLRSPLLRPAPIFTVGNLRSRELCHRFSELLGRGSGFVSRAIVAPGLLPGVRSSDHWSFWQERMPAIMITAGGPLTYWHYHRPSDSVEHTVTDHLPELTVACAQAIVALSRSHATGA